MPEALSPEEAARMVDRERASRARSVRQADVGKDRERIARGQRRTALLAIIGLSALLVVTVGVYAHVRGTPQDAGTPVDDLRPLAERVKDLPATPPVTDEATLVALEGLARVMDAALHGVHVSGSVLDSLPAAQAVRLRRTDTSNLVARCDVVVIRFHIAHLKHRLQGEATLRRVISPLVDLKGALRDGNLDAATAAADALSDVLESVSKDDRDAGVGEK